MEQRYHPFGSLLPGRNYNSGSYRYLFQGQEHDDEINDGVGTSYAFEYRIHDPRGGRFLSIDPLAAKYPWNSPYAFAENKVIKFIELEGLETARNYGDYQGQMGTDWGIVPGGAWGANEATNWTGELSSGRQFEIFQCPDCTGPSGRKDNPLMYQLSPLHPPVADTPSPAGTTDATGSGGSPEDRARTGADHSKPVLEVTKNESGVKNPPISEKKRDYFKNMITMSRSSDGGTENFSDMLEGARRMLSKSDSRTFQLVGLSGDEMEKARTFFKDNGLDGRERTTLPLDDSGTQPAGNGVRIGSVTTH